MVYPDVELRSAGSATINAPADWVGNLTALYVLTVDYTQIVAKNPKGIIKFKAGCDAASIVQ
jgi:hypothetical protein